LRRELAAPFFSLRLFFLCLNKAEKAPHNGKELKVFPLLGGDTKGACREDFMGAGALSHATLILQNFDIFSSRISIGF